MSDFTHYESESSSTQTINRKHTKQESSQEGDDVDAYLDPQSFLGDEADLEKNGGNPADNEDNGLTRLESSAAASREMSRRLMGADKLVEEANATDEPLPPMGGDRDYPPPVGDRDIYSVSFNGKDDPIFPHNWPTRRKLVLCYVVGILALAASVGSAMFAEGAAQVEEKFHVGETVATLGTSLYVFGFASGPIIWGPLSELYGRGAVLLPACFVFICFSFAVATAENIQTIMICRFFAGFFGAAPLVAAPASLADLFGAGARGSAMAIFAMVLFGGPMLGPIFGGFIVKNPDMGWRWTSYISGLIGVLALLSTYFFYKETHHPLILVEKAENLRRRTGNWAIHAPHEEMQLSFKEMCEKNITRPLLMLFTEPILFSVALYNSFIYGLLYLMLTAVPLVFEGQYHWRPGTAQLPYLSMLIGIFFGGLLCVRLDKRYRRIMHENGGKAVPEERLTPMMIGSVFYAVGLFWLGWTGDFPETIHWIVPTISLSFIGFGLVTIFLPCINYIVDCYLLFAASALAGNTFMRSAFGGAFPLFATQMFNAMTIKYACTLLGCVATVMIPVPFLFYKYGARLRKKSKFAFATEGEM